MRPRRTPARLFCWAAADQTRRIWHWQAFTRKGATIGRNLRICKPTSNSNRPIQTNKSCTIFWKRYSDWQTTWQNRGEPQQSRVVCSTFAPHISGPWLTKSARRARHLRCAGHVRGAVGNQGVLVASIPDFIRGALLFIVSPILEELVFLPCCG
jgi:hypothetical protein